jgi:hypothetical protein
MSGARRFLQALGAGGSDSDLHAEDQPGPGCAGKGRAQGSQHRVNRPGVRDFARIAGRLAKMRLGTIVKSADWQTLPAHVRRDVSLKRSADHARSPRGSYLPDIRISRGMRRRSGGGRRVRSRRSRFIDRAVQRWSPAITPREHYPNAALYDFSCPAPTRKMAARVMKPPSGP